MAQLPLTELLALIVLISAVATRLSDGDDCPQSTVSEVCHNGTLLLVAEKYLKDAKDNCVKVVDRRQLPELICPPPTLIKASPCSSEGQMTEFYEAYRKLNCKCEKVIISQQKACPCEPCETTRKDCDPHSKTVEVTTICYRHGTNGRCDPVRQVSYEPCGDCPNSVARRELPCDYCKGRRDVVLVTQFREESSPRRCLVSERRISEPCECKKGVTTKFVCVNNDARMRQMTHRRQISCFECSTKTIEVVEKKIKCRGQALVRQPCKRDPTTGIGFQEIRLVSERSVNCTCTRSVRAIKQVCSCPPGVKQETVCHGHSNTMIVKSIRYRLHQKDRNHVSCRAVVHLKHLPPPPCPPLNETVAENQSVLLKEVCDPQICQRHIVASEWQLEGCECRRMVRKEVAGKCCCPKSNIEVSPCVGNQRSVHKNSYVLINGQCLRHVTNKIEPCRSNLQDSHRVYCDETLGAKVYETSTFRELAGGTLETLQRRTIPVVCNDTYVESAGACKRDATTGRMVRTAVVMSSSREGCECTAPRAHILTTACDCVDVETGEVKQEGESFREEVPCETHCTPGGELCGTPACQRKSRWFNMIYLGEGDPPRCRCPADSKITRTCNLDGGAKWQMAQTRYRLEAGRCTPQETRWQETVNCSEGLVGQERGPRRPEGLQEVRLVFETLVGCKCVRAEKQLQCPWRCPEPTRHVYCDTALGGESVVEVTRFNLIGCKCQRQVQSKRSKIICPVYSELVSRNCSTSTGKETVIRKRMVQDGCMCKVVLETSYEQCGCPPDRKGKAICNPATNELEQTITKFILIGGKCREIVETERRPVRCSEDLLTTHQAMKQPLLRCNKETGQGELVRPVWRVSECKCTRGEEILLRGRCPCPKAETIYTPCDPLTGKKKMIVVSYVPENCICKRREEEHSLSCRCGADKPSFGKSLCNVLRREISMEGTLKEWRDDINQCVDVVKRITYPHVCSPKVKFIQSPCMKGKMEVKKIIQEPDPNDCKCITNVTVSRVDCRCPPKKTVLGSCDSGEERQTLVYLDRDWDALTKQCIYKNRHQEDLVCDCPISTESTLCVKGLMEARRTRYEVYMGRLGCKREEEVQRWQPNCSAKAVREDFGQCNLTTCRRSLTVYTQTYNPATCQCDWQIKEEKQCSCCGCPEPKVTFTCHNNTEWIAQSDYYVPHVKGCGHACRKHSIVSRQPIQCNVSAEETERRWSECDKSTCLQELFYTEASPVHCECGKRKRVLQTRQCCCTQEPEESDKCHEGTLLHVLKTVSLVDHRCKESVQYVTKQTECDQPSERKTGVCDPLTCKRPLFEVTYTRDKESCECLPRQKLIGSEDCCCLPPPKPTKTCVGECYMNVQTLAHFDEAQKTCVRTESVNRHCPTCPLPSEVVKPCGSAGNCVQSVTRTEYHLEDCKCKPREVVTTRNCCCQQPPEERQQEDKAGTCLPKEHVLLYRRVAYESTFPLTMVNGLLLSPRIPIILEMANCSARFSLVDGKCVKRIEEHRTPVECPPREVNGSQPLVERGECNKASCLRKVKQSRWVLNGCRCQQMTSESTEACCCNQFRPQVKEICRSDGTILKETKYWNASDGKCKPEVFVEVLPKVECPPIKVQPTGPCEISTGRQPIKIAKYEFKNCKCLPVNETIKDRQCRCKENEETYGECDAITCLQNVTVTQYKQEGGVCRAQLPITKLRPCCCTPKESEPKVLRECNPKTGSIHETTVKHVFDKAKSECRPVKAVRILPPNECPKKPLIKRGRCNIASGVAIDIVARSLFDTKSCTCGKSVAPVQRICDCSHLPTIPSETHCDEENAELVTTETKFVLENNACVNKTEGHRQKIVCPPVQETPGTCDHETCQTTVETTRHVLEGCRCVERRSSHHETCCCPRPQVTEACLENGTLLIQRHVNYTFNPEKRSCETAVRVVRQPIDCEANRSVEISRHCNTMTCRPTRLVEVHTPQNCKCTPRRLTVVDNERHCCCRPPKETFSCQNDRGLVAKRNLSYTLENDTCIAKVVKSEEKIRCPEPYVTLGPCSHETKMQAVTNVSYDLQDCKCRKRVTRSTQACGCPAPEIALGQCSNESQTRNVSRVSYTPVNGTCVKKVKVLRSEPCKCPLSRTTRRCEEGSWVRRSYTYRLTERDGRTDCIKEIETEKALVTCPPASQLTSGECDAEKQSRNVSSKHFLVNPTTCQCVSHVEIKLEACDCHRKNRKEVICNGRELTIDNYEYFSNPGDQNCSLKTSHEVKTITCPTNRQVVRQSGGCVIRRANGTYRAEVTRWQELKQCECVPREEIVEKLCDCPQPEASSRCADNSLLITEHLHFTRRGDQCTAERVMTRQKTRCESETQISGVSSCTKSANESGECYETVAVEQYYVENCKCLKKSLTLRRLCCAPPAKTRRRCDAKRRQWKSTVTKFSIVPGDVLFSYGNVTILDNKLSALNYETTDMVVCPAKTVHEDCNKETDAWTQTTTWFEIDDCKCKKREVVKTGKCACPKREVWKSPCEKHFQTVKIKSYEFVDGECVPYVTSTRERCSCPDGSFQRVRCDGNSQLTKCTLTYTFVAASRQCKARKLCVSWLQSCPASKRYSVGTCGPETGYRQRISEVNYNLDKATCKCKARIINRWDAYCGCAHLNSQNVSCDNGVKTTTVTTYKLIDGECIPDEDSKWEKIVCPSTREEIGACDRDPNSPTRGLLTKTIYTYDIDKCNCIPRTSNVSEICDCNLRYGGRNETKCQDNEVEVSTTQWTLKDGDCQPTTRISRSSLRCRPPRVDRRCIDNGTTLVERRSKFILTTDGPTPVCTEQQTERPISACSLKGGSKTWKVRGPCNPSTCRRTVHVYKRASQGCKCPTKKMTRTEVCCCPKSKPVNTTCLARVHVLEKSFISHALISTVIIDGKRHAVEPYCTEMKHKIRLPVTCGATKPRILMGECQADQNQTVQVIGSHPIGCQCKDYKIRRLSIRCGCPKFLKHVYGQCVNAQQVEKVVTLQAVSYTKSLNGSRVNASRCRPVVASRRTLPCACAEKPQVLSKCLSGNLLRVEETQLQFNATSRICQRETIERVLPTICPLPKKTISECGGEETGFTATETVTTWTPVDCECVPKTTERPFVCNCTAKYPSHSRKVCKMDHILETTVTSSRLKGYKCVPHIVKSTTQISATETLAATLPMGQRPSVPTASVRPGRGDHASVLHPVYWLRHGDACPIELRSMKSPTCDETTRKRQVAWFEKVPVDCKCEWQPITSAAALKALGLPSFEWCSCPDIMEVESKCRPTGSDQYLHQRTLVKYQRQGSDCTPVRETLYSNFSCKEGTHTYKSACDPLTGLSTERRVTMRVEDCVCRLVTESSRRCACACAPTPLIHTTCRPENGLIETIEESLELVDCECRRRVRRTSRIVDCPGAGGAVLQRHESTCMVDKNSGNSYRNVTWITNDREGCRCVQRRHWAREICACNPQERNFTRCVDNARLEIRTIRRVLTEGNRCVKKEIARTVLAVSCPEARVVESVCDNVTGLATVSKLQPVIEKCQCRTQLQHYKIPCKCNPLEKLIHKSPCNKTTCLSTAIYAYEVPDPSSNSSCVIKKVVKEVKCCCPPPQREHFCEPSSGMSGIGVREFHLSNGQCVPVMRITLEQPLICPHNETTFTKTMKSGKIRFFRNTAVREGCKCRNNRETVHSQWECPKSTRNKTCVKLDGTNQFAWQTTISLWRASKGKVPTCEHHEVKTDASPVTCLPPNVTESVCFPVDARHGFVRNVTIHSMRAVGCGCVSGEPEVKVEICNCSQPVVNITYSESEGLITETVIQFNATSDRSRCVPHEIRRQWRLTCFPTEPVLRNTTTCKNGRFYKIFMKRTPEGFRCRTLIKRVSHPCDCPKPVTRTTCLSDGITKLVTTTRFTRRRLEGPCEREERSVKSVTSCDKLPEEELRAGRDYTISPVGGNSTYSVLHVYSCGTGGSACTRRVVRVTITRAPDGCRCAVRRTEGSEACCCNAEGLLSNIEKPKKSQWVDCESMNHPISVRQQRTWHLMDGKCWPLTFTSSKPLVCSDKEVVRPVGTCINGTQRFLVVKSVRDDCRCKTVKSIESRPCLCQTVSSAEVIFVVDESVSSRAPDYSRRVRDILQLTIHAFKDSHNGTLGAFRFAVVKYSSDPSIAFNLGQYDESAPMLSHVERLNYEGRLSNINKALALTKREVLPRVRAGVTTMIYVISDGVNDESAGASQIASELAAAGIQILALAVGADARGQAFLRSLTSKPRSRHFMVYALEEKADVLSNWLINSLCIQACPEGTQTRGFCSRETGCLGHIYEHSYRFNTDLGKCIGTSTRRPYRCCCLEAPREESRCVNGSLILIKELWKLSKSKNGLSVCQHFKIEQGVTGQLLRDCPPEEIQQGGCNSDGVRTEVTIKRKLEDCKCKVTKQEATKRCICDSKTREEERCIGDNVVWLTIRKEVLNADGYCEEKETVVKKSISCAEPKMIAGACDPLTCKRRLIYVREQPEQCKCREKRKAFFELCCCLASRTASRETDCFNDTTRVTTETSIDFSKDKRSCVKKTELFYEPVDCPTSSVFIKSECVHIGNDTNVVTESEKQSDSNLLYRRVEVISWDLVNCRCLASRRWEFETCGCREVENPEVHECHDKEGILISYQQNYQLSVSGTNGTYVGSEAIGKRFNQLKQASCMPVFSGRTILQTECPLSSVHYSNCSNGYMTVTIDVVSLKACKCKTNRLTRQLRCLEIAMDGRNLGPLGTKDQRKKRQDKPLKQNVINFIECADLLPSDKCVELDKGPNSQCDIPGQIRDELCRKTCHLCQDLPINRTDFTAEVSGPNDCLVTDVRYDRRYHLTTLKSAGLSRCKYACNNDPRCMGFDFYVPLNEAVQGSCVLSTVDRLTLQRRLNLKKVEAGANAEDLSRMDSKRCIRFQRVRRPRDLEPTLNYIFNCTCENLSSENALAFTISSVDDESSKGRLHCVKEAEIRAVNWRGQVTCQPPGIPASRGRSGSSNTTTEARQASSTDPCLDMKSTEWCEEVAKTAACKQPAFRSVCGGTCGVCVCNRSYEYVGRCLPNGRMTVVKIENTYSFLHGRCVSTKHVRVFPCEVCPAQPYELIQPCDPKTEARLVVHVIPVFNSSNPNKCKLKVSKKALSCKDCMFEGAHSIERSSVSSCKKRGNGTHRQVLRTEYVVNEDGCCKIRRSLRSFPCVGCPAPRVSLSKCLGGWQLRTIIFFTRPTTGKFSDEGKGIPSSACFRHVISTKERCIVTETNRKSGCTDLLGSRECREFKDGDLCLGNPEIARKLCARQCNLC
ncbi:Collagen alpha-3(VI) chain [Echinococcus granulosus]|uniref:Collagen alpha-3(VI) chain n=1 Tax=Echinococcus granulosus TaxID=6210 RepID=W6UV63_ECHGR|nr:Collagen alpha-3(VI) chain [Echinococcus granulosus]EUB62272.1 Collagen alpha-3(VI) chain [Echinococcus granulosus]